MLGRVNGRLSGAVLLAVLMLFPIVGGWYQTGLIAKFLVFGLLALSLDLLWGYVGLLSFGHASFFALGSYALALTLKHLAFPGATWVALLLAMIVPALLGGLLGYFIFYGRVTGVYFGIITLALGVALQQIFVSWASFTGGDNGLYGYATPNVGIPGLVSLPLDNAYVLYYVCVIATVAVFFATRRLTRTPFGRALQGIRTNEERMAFCGYDTPPYKVAALAIACGIAGLAGALFAPNPTGFVSPALFSLSLSTEAIIWVAVGGRGTLAGGLLGALLINFLGAFLSSSFVTVWRLLIGLFLIVVVVFWPQGILGGVRDWRAKRMAARPTRAKGVA